MKTIARGLSRHSLFVLSLLLGAAFEADAQLNRENPSILQGVGVDERIGGAIDGDLLFLDHEGRQIRLQEILDQGKPVLLNPLYYDCPVLCNLVVDGVAESVARMDWLAGEDYLIVSFTVDSLEGPSDAALTRERIAAGLQRPDAMQGWYFLSDPGVAAGSAARLAHSIGFHYKPEPRTGEIIHPAAIAFIRPERGEPGAAGHVIRYLYGFSFEPFELKNALYETAMGNIGNPVEQILLYCYTYDPDSRSYVPLAWKIMKLGGLATALILGIFLTVLWLRETARKRASLLHSNTK